MVYAVLYVVSTAAVNYILTVVLLDAGISFAQSTIALKANIAAH